MIVFFSVVLLVFFSASWYVYSRGAKALADTGFQRVFTWMYWGFSLMFILGQVLERGNPGLLAKMISQVGSLWLAFFLYIFLFVVLVDVFRLIQYYFHVFPESLIHGIFLGKYLALSGLIVSLLITLMGFFNARNPVVRHFDLEIEKNKSQRDSLTLVLATDVHLGVLLGGKHAQKLVRMINEQNPDIVLFAGDLVDHNPVPVVKNNMGDCLAEIKAPMGVYAITGNHEFIGKAEVSINYFSKHGVQYIRDSIFVINNVIQIAGREDKDKPRFVGSERKSLEKILQNRNPELPLILLDHQPVDYDLAEKENIDLMLSGHTHKGQLWPLGYITNLVYKNHYGLLKNGGTYFYTSSGFGTWGPTVRTGNRPELVVFKIHLK